MSWVITVTSPRQALDICFPIIDDTDMRNSYKPIPSEHEFATYSDAEKRKDGKILDTKSPQLKNWLDETPKQESWTSISYYARDSQKGSK